MSRIKELPEASSHLLTCSQVITSIQSVVKELLENALDSRATSIEIKLENFGFDKIEVKDNGDGILKDDIHFVAKPHCTSKISSHLDLVKISSYGFRGEALAAICAVADLAITTKTENEEFGYTYTFDHNGNVLSSSPCPCNQGTSVVVTNLFSNLPVRKQLYRSEKKKREELKFIEDILIAFGCILLKIRLALYHNRNLIWQKSVVDRTIDGLRLALGDIANYMENCEYVDDENQIKIEVFLPKCKAPLNCGQVSSNRSIVAVNKRPVRMKNIDKLLKEYYCKNLGDGHKARYPVCFISIEVPITDIDINYEPNKTAVLLHNMDIIKEQLSKLLSTFYNTGLNIETNSVSEKASGVSCFKSIQDKATKEPAIDDTSNNIGKENGTPHFHLNTLDFANGIQNNKPKENVLSKKLSRRHDFLSPSNKKVRTSVSTPPNDIYRHINTLEAFFTSENKSSDDTDVKSNNSSVNELNVEMLCKKGVNSENSSLRSENSVPDQNTMCITVHRKGVDLNEDILVLNALDKSIAETSAQNNSLFSDSSKSLSSCSETKPNSCSNSFNIHKTGGLQTNDTIKDTFVSARSILQNERIQELQLVEANKSSTTSDENPQKAQKNKSNHMPVASDLLTDDDWSRGLHPVENIQPVAVLKPKKLETSTETNKSIPNVECIEIKEPRMVPMIQRKITPFDFFCRKHRLEVASLNPELNNQQIAAILSEKWNRLPSEEKAVYKNMVSKDYPKDIKNKEKLGKIVSENIHKIKRNSTNSKKVVPKNRRKRLEKNISFELELLKECNLDSSFEKKDDDSYKVINCLTPGIWICSQSHRLYLLNCYRLQEAIIYFRLLETYEFQTEQLESSFILSSSSLGNDALNVLLQMEIVEEYGSAYISDKRLTSNGFQMKILQGTNEIQFELIGMTNNMAFYGISDLKEILCLIKEKGFNAKLSDCRPGKAVLYLQGEAVRIARQCPASKKVEDIVELLKKIDSLPSKTCLHSKPFLHELYELNTIQCQ